MISTYISSTPSTYARDLAEVAFSGALAGKRVALVLDHYDLHGVERALTVRAAESGTVHSLRMSRLVLDSEGSILIATYPSVLAGALFDLVVEGERVHPKLVEAARGRLVGAIQ